MKTAKLYSEYEEEVKKILRQRTLKRPKSAAAFWETEEWQMALRKEYEKYLLDSNDIREWYEFINDTKRLFTQMHIEKQD